MGETFTFSDIITGASWMALLGGFMLLLYGTIGYVKSKGKQKVLPVCGIFLMIFGMLLGKLT